MKIGYFITYFPYKARLDDTDYFEQYHHGGAEIGAYYLAINMAQRGHELAVFTTSINSKDSFERQEGINVHRYSTSFGIKKGNFSFKLFQKPLDLELDIVHAHFSTPPAELAALKYAKRKKVPFILTYHGDGQEGFGGVVRRRTMYFYNKYLLDKVLSSSDVIISPSEYYINESRFLGKYRDKIVVIPNGVNIEELDIPYSKEECRERLELSINSNIILFVGSLTPYKGPDILVRAMRDVLKEISDTSLVFVGGGKMQSELKELANKLEIRKYIEFVGFVAEDLKPLYYKAADVFVLPSTMSTEVFPLVLLEASSSGLPMVVSDLDTFKCIIDEGYNGLFTKRGDENNLADAIIYLLENEDVREKMGKNARRKVEDYSWERIVEETEKVYKEVIS